MNAFLWWLQTTMDREEWTVTAHWINGTPAPGRAVTGTTADAIAAAIPSPGAAFAAFEATSRTAP